MAITLNAASDGYGLGLTGYVSAAVGYGIVFGSISGEVLPGITLVAITTSSTNDVMGFGGDTRASLPFTEFTVNGNVWTLGSGTYYSSQGYTEYTVSTSGPEFSNGVSYTLDFGGGGVPEVLPPYVGTDDLANLLIGGETVAQIYIGPDET